MNCALVLFELSITRRGYFMKSKHELTADTRGSSYLYIFSKRYPLRLQEDESEDEERERLPPVVS